MKIGAMNNPRLEILDEVEQIGKAGFDFIDLTYEWPSSQKAEPDIILEKISEYGLEIVGHTSPALPAIYPSKKIQDACIDELKHSVDFFSQLKIVRKVNIHPFYFAGFHDEKEVVAKNIEILQIISSYAQQANIIIMLENFIGPFDNAKVFAKILKAVPELRIHLDVGHINLTSDFRMLKTFLKKFPEKIIHCHIHDNHGKKDEHLPIGCGNIDWKRVAMIFKENGYDSTFTLEVFCHDRAYLYYSKDKWRRIWGQA